MARFPSLPEKLRSVLSEVFPSPDAVRVSENDGLIGIVVSTRFEDLDDIDRQNIVWDVLDQRLTSEERREIAIIVTVTPREEAGHLATNLD